MIPRPLLAYVVVLTVFLAWYFAQVDRMDTEVNRARETTEVADP